MNFNLLEGDRVCKWNDFYGVKRRGICNSISISKKDYDEYDGEYPKVEFKNNYMPRVYLQLTGRCNFKCLHCFAAVDNNPLVSEYTYDEAIKLLDDMYDCGVSSITITGGEPTVFPRLMDFIDEMYKRDIVLLDFNTNGYLLTQEMLDHFKEIKCDPNIKISLDGIGTHDEMRGVKGAEQRAIEAIKMCIASGFRTYSQTQVNKKTLPVLWDTIQYLDSIGLYSCRLIKTTETPRWRDNNNGTSFSFREYYQEMYDIVERYLSKPHKMDLDIWEFMFVDPKQYYPITSGDFDKKVCDDDYTCPVRHQMMSIGSNGNVYPCLEIQGSLDELGYKFGNVKTDGLKKLLQPGSDYWKSISETVKERREHNKECRECEFNDRCNGGCPALGLIYSLGDSIGVDQSKCMFYKEGYYKKYYEMKKKNINDFLLPEYRTKDRYPF